MRVGIYVHVPEKEGVQTAENQLLQMKAMAMRDGWEVYRAYYDAVSLGQEERPEYERMLSDAEQHRFDVLLFWTLESLSPGNAGQTLALLHKLSEWGIAFCSYKEHHLNSSHFLKEAVVSLIATLAHQDNVYIKRRTIAGLEKQQRSRKAGPSGRLGPGRPPVEFDHEKAKKLRAEKVTYEKIAEVCKVSKATITRYFKSLKA